MYGFTEAFRSTYLPAAEIDERPTSIGHAIPETDVFLVNDRDERCQPGEEGKVLHVVQKGYQLQDKVIRPAMVIVGESQ